MNKKLILDLADRVEESKTYSQSVYYTWSRAPACIAGHCVAMHPEFAEFVGESRCILKEDQGNAQHIHILARKMLGLEKDQATKLFLTCPPGHVQYDQFGEYTSVTN